MDEYSLFTVALGLEKPWEVVDIKFSIDKNTAHTAELMKKKGMGEQCVDEISKMFYK